MHDDLLTFEQLYPGAIAEDQGCVFGYCDYLSQLKSCFESDYWDYYKENDPKAKRIHALEQEHFERFPEAKFYAKGGMQCVLLKRYRDIAGMTQQQLADALSYDRVHYGYIEAGQRPMVDRFYQRAIAKMLRHCEEKTRLLRAENDRV